MDRNKNQKTANLAVVILRKISLNPHKKKSSDLETLVNIILRVFLY